jgi:uncharacterized protein
MQQERSGLVVGFDLDLTLLDSRAGIRAALDALSAETGVRIDSAAAVTRLGPPLQEELARWFEPDDVDDAVSRYLRLYPQYAVERSTAMPGAEEALAAVRRQHGRSVVVTAKYAPNADVHLRHLGLDTDEVIGGLWGAAVYVGDPVLAVAGARAAGATSVALATGPCSAEELADAGADVVLPDLYAFPAWLEGHLLGSRLADLESRLREHRRLVVAFSGGADSAFLLAAAVRALGADDVIAATAVSGSLPAAELAAARDFAADLGVRHLTPSTHEIEREGYRANAGDRCYFCKAELLDVLGPVAEREGAVAATGTNADDAVAGFRPGIRAAAERGAATPLRDAGLTKAQVREASRRWGLRTWDKPAAACQSSRIAYGVEVTPHRLARVERAESALRDWLHRYGVPVHDLRVRDLGDLARVEVDAQHVERLQQADAALAAVRAAGFDEVEVDGRGFRSGAMNELLADPGRYR